MPLSKNEAAFAQKLVKKLRERLWFVQRIESGETGRGIPDIYCIDNNHRARWIELKRIKTVFHPLKQVITWRPGQQVWLHTVTTRKQRAVTLVEFNDVFVLIPHHQLYKDDTIKMSEHPIRVYRTMLDMIKDMEEI